MYTISLAGDCKLLTPFTNIWRQYPNPHFFAFADKIDDLVWVSDAGVQHCRHELHRIVSLQVGGLIRNQTISYGVRLVKTIARKVIDQVKNLVRFLLGAHPTRYPLNKFWICTTALNKLLALLSQHLRNLLANRSTQQIRLSQSKLGKYLYSLHDLLLVNHHAIGFLENFCHQGVGIDHLLSPMFTLNKVFNHPRS